MPYALTMYVIPYTCTLPRGLEPSILHYPSCQWQKQSTNFAFVRTSALLDLLLVEGGTGVAAEYTYRVMSKRLVYFMLNFMLRTCHSRLRQPQAATNRALLVGQVFRVGCYLLG